MKQSIFKPLAIILLITITGCASSSHVKTDNVDSYALQQQVNLALSTWRQQHDYDTAVMRLERLSSLRGGGFEQARLTSLALIHLERGNRTAFLETAGQLGSAIGPYSYVDPQTQHVMTVAYAMQGKSASELPGRGYDNNRVQTIYRLLGVTA